MFLSSSLSSLPTPEPALTTATAAATASTTNQYDNAPSSPPLPLEDESLHIQDLSSQSDGALLGNTHASSKNNTCNNSTGIRRRRRNEVHSRTTTVPPSTTTNNPVVDADTVNMLLEEIGALKQRLETMEAEKQQQQLQERTQPMRLSGASTSTALSTTGTSSHFEFLNGSAMNLSPHNHHFQNSANSNSQLLLTNTNDGSFSTLGGASSAHFYSNHQPTSSRSLPLIKEDAKTTRNDSDIEDEEQDKEHDSDKDEDEKRDSKQSKTRLKSRKRWKGYHEALKGNSSLKDFTNKSSLVFLHPEEVGERFYTKKELAKIQYRPFPSRLFITNVQFEWNTVWLRTRHTDHHCHKSSFIQVRDAFKVSKSRTCF